MGSLVGLIVALVAAGPPPAPGGTVAPPPALLWAQAGATWMQQGSYCWTEGERGACVDFGGFGRAPVVRLREGETIVVGLGFRPRRASLTADDRTYRLTPGRQLRWRVRGQPRVVSVFARPARGGDASYGVRVAGSGP